MNILITGANGFLGKNLIENLRAIQDGRNRTRDIQIDNIMSFDIDTNKEKLDEYCRMTDFVFHLAGVNRPKQTKDYHDGNVNLSIELLTMLEKYKNKCPVMLASSIQASLEGRFQESEYGRSKLEAENAFFEYGKRNGIRTLVYRFPNIFGKWCRPDYNSVVATFCHRIANDQEIRMDDRERELELLYIDDFLDGMFDALEGNEIRCVYNGSVPTQSEDGKFCFLPSTYHVTLGKIADLLYEFKNFNSTLEMPAMPEGGFEKKLFATFLSYFPKEKIAFPLKMNIDKRGSFTEVLRTSGSGMFSVNIAKPRTAKGEHWHNTKWEIFIVVSGQALIRLRKVGTEDIIEYKVSGEKLEALQMLPGYTHSITNLSDTDDLVTLMWANEPFDPSRPDTYTEFVSN